MSHPTPDPPGLQLTHDGFKLPFVYRGWAEELVFWLVTLVPIGLLAGFLDFDIALWVGAIAAHTGLTWLYRRFSKGLVTVDPHVVRVERRIGDWTVRRRSVPLGDVGKIIRKRQDARTRDREEVEVIELMSGGRKLLEIPGLDIHQSHWLEQQLQQVVAGARQLEAHDPPPPELQKTRPRG